MTDIPRQTIDEAILQAASFEKTSAEFYARLVAGFSYLPGVAAFFDEMRREEIDHEKAVMSVRAALPAAELAAEAPLELSLNLVNIQKLLDLVLGYAIENLHDAYELSYQLEFSEVNSVFKLLLTQVAPREKREAFLDMSLDGHQHKLDDFDDLFGDHVWRRQQKFQK